MLNLLLALERSRRGLTVSQMLNQLELDCSRRTLYRDLEQLTQAGFPIVAEGERYKLSGSPEGVWTIPVDPTMVLALTLSQDVLGPLRGTVLAEPLAELRARLLAMLTPATRGFLEEIRSTMLGTTPAAPEYAPQDPVIRSARDAIEREHRLQIRYTKPDAPAHDRIIEPYCIWVISGRLYLIGFDLERQDMRTFAVQRIENASVLDEAFEPDPGFDPDEFVQRGFGVFHGSVHRVVLEFDAEVAYVARERRFHRTQLLHDHPEGGVRLVMDAAGLPEIAAWVASYGGRIHPVEPPELVERVRAIHKAGLAKINRT